MAKPIQSFFLSHRWLAMRKKIRNKKRFFKRIIKKAEKFELPRPEELVSSGWHWHCDFWEDGSRGWKFRERYIEAHCIIFRKFAQNLNLYKEPYQLYMLLYRDESSSDAVYFNVPDEEKVYFPVTYPKAEWGVPELEEYFGKLLAPYRIKVGYMKGGEISGLTISDSFIIYSPDLGLPIE